MICSNCGVEIEPGFDFCAACGIRLGAGRVLAGEDDTAKDGTAEKTAAALIKESVEVKDEQLKELVEEEPDEPASPIILEQEDSVTEAQAVSVDLEEINDTICAGQSQPAEPAPRMLVGSGVGVRFIATIIDLVVLSILIKILAAPYNLVLTMGTGMMLSGGALWVSLLVVLVYYISMEAWLGGTAGKLLLGLKIVMEDGRKITFDAAALRTFMRVIDGLFFYLVAALFVWKSPKKQRFGDRVARTLVVSRDYFK